MIDLIKKITDEIKIREGFYKIFIKLKDERVMMRIIF
jgi:hypothetical protein